MTTSNDDSDDGFEAAMMSMAMFVAHQSMMFAAHHNMMMASASASASWATMLAATTVGRSTALATAAFAAAAAAGTGGLVGGVADSTDSDSEQAESDSSGEGGVAAVGWEATAQHQEASREAAAVLHGQAGSPF